MFLEQRCSIARDKLNAEFENDSGGSHAEWARGNLSAYTEVMEFVEKRIKNKSYNEADET